MLMKVARLLALVLTVVSPSQAIADGDGGDLQAVLHRHVVWLGGQSALERLRDISWTGTIAVAGLEGVAKRQSTRAGWLNQQLHPGPIDTATVIGPAGTWRRTLSGQVEARGADSARAEIEEVGRAFHLHLLHDGVGLPAGVQRSDLGLVERGGQQWRVVRWTYSPGDLFDLFVNPQDGSCGWTRQILGTRTEYRQLADWRRVQGIRIPFAERSFFDNPANDQTIQWSTVKTNQGLAANRFSRPLASGNLVAFRKDGGTTDWIPLTMGGGLIRIEGLVNGHRTPIVIDSNADMMTTSIPAAADLGLHPVGRLSLAGVVGAQLGGIAPGVRIEIANLVLSDVITTVTDVRAMEQAKREAIPILLGGVLFAAAVVEIDYPNARMALHDPANFRPDSDAQALPLAPSGWSRRCVLARIEDLPPAYFSLDTGSDTAVTIFAGYVKTHDLLRGRSPWSQTLLAGLGGMTPETVATLARFALGGFEWTGVPAKFHQGGGFGMFNTASLAGNLGAGILSRFRVVLDYPHDKMYLTAAVDGQTRPFDRNHLGLFLRIEPDHLAVIFVAPNSPAAAAGWKVGDRIVAVDGQPVGSAVSGTSIGWLSRPVGTRVVLTDGKGQTRPMVLATYY
jgi:membrane-associated protease RseP (regulator of RpoE activity)